MKKYLTIEVWVDDTIEDYKECVDEVIESAKGHEYCCDGTVDIKVIE